MKNNQIDADKIVRHIKYTKHWLDKANTDFQDKNFASGSAVLNLARAELTAAWEEAMQLKTELFRNVPQKARANWKPAASIALLASGFMIAFVLTQFTANRVPRETTDTDQTPAIVLPQQPVAEPANPTAVATPAPAASQIQETAAPTQSVLKHHVARNVETDKTETIIKPSFSNTNISVPPLSHTPEVIPAVVPEKQVQTAQPVEKLPYSPVGHAAPESQTQPAANKSNELNQADVIELFKTAEHSLKK